MSRATPELVNAPVRPAIETDLPQLITLCRDHAAYEQARPPGPELPDRLFAALFSPPIRLWCRVAASGDRLLGYATYSLEFATWLGAEYLHLDCLFVRETYRGLGLGRRLVDAVIEDARGLGVGEVQWQTPVWNTGAIRFYDRLGADGVPKVRYVLPVDDSHI